MGWMRMGVGGRGNYTHYLIGLVSTSDIRLPFMGSLPFRGVVYVLTNAYN